MGARIEATFGSQVCFWADAGPPVKAASTTARRTGLRSRTFVQHELGPLPGRPRGSGAPSLAGERPEIEDVGLHRGCSRPILIGCEAAERRLDPNIYTGLQTSLMQLGGRNLNR